MANERNDISIEESTATWTLNATGSLQGTYIGQFKFRCYLTPMQKITASREYRELLGAHPTLAPEHESFLAYALTQLKQRVISSPPFWSSTLQMSNMSGDLPDENVISEVLDAAIASEIKYKELMKKKKEDALDRSKKAAEKMLSENPEVEDESED